MGDKNGIFESIKNYLSDKTAKLPKLREGNLEFFDSLLLNKTMFREEFSAIRKEVKEQYTKFTETWIQSLIDKIQISETHGQQSGENNEITQNLEEFKTQVKKELIPEIVKKFQPTPFGRLMLSFLLLFIEKPFEAAGDVFVKSCELVLLIVFVLGFLCLSVANEENYHVIWRKLNMLLNLIGQNITESRFAKMIIRRFKDFSTFTSKNVKWLKLIITTFKYYRYVSKERYEIKNYIDSKIGNNKIVQFLETYPSAVGTLFMKLPENSYCKVLYRIHMNTNRGNLKTKLYFHLYTADPNIVNGFITYLNMSSKKMLIFKNDSILTLRDLVVFDKLIKFINGTEKKSDDIEKIYSTCFEFIDENVDQVKSNEEQQSEEDIVMGTRVVNYEIFSLVRKVRNIIKAKKELQSISKDLEVLKDKLGEPILPNELITEPAKVAGGKRINKKSRTHRKQHPMKSKGKTLRSCKKTYTNFL